ncbi:MAG: hypothetical protein JNM28_02750 [Armatimonadetes bacterium]|nr:hypothetical protein [Armatimonadota bacterium]MBS1712010.1 hypothetical protein [Armatimonadota bacterium]MBX3109436.1 hypothetical protein [Fimbriimonadaceae bacterium]
MGTLELVVCAECSAKNTIDGAYCRQCGFPLPVEVRDEMKAEAEKMLIDGRQLLNDGRIDEAGLVADAVLEIDPSNANALALRGDIFEKDGMFAEALETYQRVQALRPDNAMDRIRTAHLEKLVAAGEIAVEEPHSARRGVLLVAAAGILLLSVGAALWVAGKPAGKVDTQGWVANRTENASGFNTLDPTMVPVVPSQTNIQSQGPGATGASADPPPTTGTVTRYPSNPSAGYTTRQDPENGLRFPTELQPWDPTAGRTVPQNPNPPANATENTGAKPEQPANTGESQPKENPGVVDITVKKGSGVDNPGTSAGAMTAEDLIRKARNLSIQEDYSGAAAAYEEAIKAGATTGATYQRLAQCYEKLGRKSDAVRNYRNAMGAFDRQIARGNASDSIKAARESCERAISALGG